jgi:hypothetical protein
MKLVLLKKDQSGMSLAETMIALGALGFLLLVGMSILRTLQIANEGADAMQDAISLKQVLLVGIDCQRTLFLAVKQGSTSKPHPYQPNEACSKGVGSNYLEIVAKIPAPLSSLSYPGEYALIRPYNSSNLEYAAPQFKNIFVRASCVDCPVCISGKTIKVEYQPRKKSVNFLDYFKRKSGQNADLSVPWKDLFSGVPFGCVAP